MDDFIILKTGYDKAINDILENLQDLPNYDIIKDRVLRQQKRYLLNGKEYEGTLLKYYDSENQLGYLIIDDIFELQGVCIFINDKKYKKISEQELVFVKNNYPLIWSETFDAKDINTKFEKLLELYSSM